MRFFSFELKAPQPSIHDLIATDHRIVRIQIYCDPRAITPLSFCKEIYISRRISLEWGHHAVAIPKHGPGDRGDLCFGKGKECSEEADYFVLRLDDDPDDPKHIKACRKALAVYIEEIKDHLPVLAKELMERYEGCLRSLK